MDSPELKGKDVSDESEKLRFAQWVLERNLGWIAASEVKAGVVVAIDTAMLGALAAAFSAIPPSDRTAWANLWTFLAGTSLAFAVFCIAMAILPRLNGPKGSKIFFGCICKEPAPDFAESFIAAAPKELLSDCLAQVHRNAEIAKDKFRWVRNGTAWSFAAIPPWVVAVASLVRM